MGGGNSSVAEEEYVGPFTSLPDHTYMLQKQQLLQQNHQGHGGQNGSGAHGLKNGLKFMLRSRSFLMKPIIAKRRVSGTSESPFSSVPSGLAINSIIFC